VRIEQVRPWALSAQTARAFRSNKVFLAGDAAHTFPPTGGLGLNTGVQDAHNLAWKLAWVMKGRASAELLQTYEIERKPVAQMNCDHSVQNFVRMDELLQPVGMDLARMRRIGPLIQSKWSGMLPRTLRYRLLRCATAWGLRRLARFEATNSRGAAAREMFIRKIPSQRSHYHFLGIDLGFQYQSAAIAGDVGNPRAHCPSISEYQPTTLPGARLPHCWVEHRNDIISTHDLVCPNRLILIATEGKGNAWRSIVASLETQFGLPLDCRLISPTEKSIRHRDGSTVHHESRTDWRIIREIAEDGALLIRPDGHIAWRSVSMPPDPEAKLLWITRQILGRVGKDGGE
jgi:2,4-dichlorophenol 6-monooxygenase